MAIKILLGVLGLCLPFLLMNGMEDGGETKTEPIVLVSDAKSVAGIVIPLQAPSSVQAAAKELQRCIELATNTEIPIVTDAESIDGSFISIGHTRQAELGGVTAEGLSFGGFRLSTQDGSLYILGPDTADGEWTPLGGISAGSANGVYSFLEKYLDVAWLFPGELGRDVPTRPGLTVPRLSITENPGFMMREVSHLEDYTDSRQREAVSEWMIRSKLGSSDHVRRRGSSASDHWQHNWRWITDEEKYFEAHPEWFPMNKEGQRWNARSKYTKLETTNPELIRYFADRAIATLKSSTRPRFFSLSPNDAPSRWSESEESRAWYDPPIGKGRENHEFKPNVPSKTSLVLKWYYDVGTLVQQEYPEGRLLGFVYSDYLFPPVKFKETLPDNISLILCGANYGYGLYDKEARERLSMLLENWSKIAPGGLYYYDIPSLLLRQEDSDPKYNFPGTTALITPSGIDNLNFLFRQLHQNMVRGAYLYGAASWTSAGMTNYILAKMLWNPELDAREVQKQWLERTYGKTAAGKLLEFYGVLEECFAKQGDVGYHVTGELLTEIYAANFPRLAGIFQQAEEESMTPVERERFVLLKNNFLLMGWRLKNAGLLPRDYQSAFIPSDADALKVLESDGADLAYFPGVVLKENYFDQDLSFFRNLDLKKSAALSESDGQSPALENHTAAVLLATKDGPVEIVPEAVHHGAFVGSYLIEDMNGNLVTSGILHPGKAITFQASEGTVYSLNIPPRNRVSAFPLSYKLRIASAKVLGRTKGESAKDQGDGEAILRVFGRAESVRQAEGSEGKFDVLLVSTKGEK